MKILNWYVTKSCIVTLCLSIGILTFAVVGSRLNEVMKLITAGGTLVAALKMMFYFIPYALALSVPLGFLVTVMLVFGRLSADNEITAMRACGISVLQIVSSIILMAFLLSFVCLYLQLYAAPRYAQIARGLIREVVRDNPTALLDPGELTQAGNMSFFVKERDPDGTLRFIDIYRIDKSGSKSKELALEKIKADSGLVVQDDENQRLNLILYGVTILQYDQATRNSANLESLYIPINYGMLLDRGKLSKNARYMNMDEMFGSMEYLQETMLRADDPDVVAKLRKEYSNVEVQLNTCFALGLAPISFLLLGLPLAIRSSRKETSIGLFLSIILALIYLVGISILGQLASYPQLYPQYLLWIPVILYQIIGIVLLRRLILQ